MLKIPELGTISLKRISSSRLGSVLPVGLALVAIWAYFGLTEPAFLSPRNFYYLFMQSSVVGTLAVGITIVLLIGDIDLSVAATSGVCAAILAVLTANLGIPAPISCLVALVAGASPWDSKLQNAGSMPRAQPILRSMATRTLLIM